MPKTQEQCAKIREETRQKILDGALSYFVRYGYGNTTVGDLAKYIGIAQGALYRYFSSKAELFQVLTEEMVRGNNNHLTRIFESPIEPEEKIKDLTKTVLDGIFYDKKVREGFVLNLRMKLEGEGTNFFSEQYDKEADTLLEKTIKEGQIRKTVVPGDATLLSDFYWHSVHMVAFDLLRGKEQSYEEYYKILTRILLLKF